MSPTGIKLVIAICLLSASAAAMATVQAGDKNSSQNNLVYEIFVRSFYDAEKEPHKNGNLKGVIGKLDSYLNDGDPSTNHDLEVGILWLMPVFPSPSYHGYDVTDYQAIHPDYGTMDDFKNLVTEAHRRGVRIILDIPFNHSSDKHPWFQQALNDKNSPYRSYYHFSPDEGRRPGGWHAVTGADGEKLRYFGLFSPRMPDFDFTNPKVRQDIKNVAKFWLDLGVDGFRLDAAKHIFGDRFDGPRDDEIKANNDWWLEFSRSVYRVKPDAILIGEVLGSPDIIRRHALGLDGLLGDPFMNELRNQVANPRPGFLGRFKQFLSDARAVHRTSFNPEFGFADHPFQSFDYVANHDRNPRLASDLEDRTHRGMQHGVDEAYRTALHVLFTFSARPILYQGDEVMQRGWKWNGSSKNARNPGDGSGIFDETLREPFPWYQTGQGPGMTTWFPSRFSKPGASRAEQDKEDGMLNLVRGLAHLRARHPALANGDVGEVLSDSGEWMVFEKYAAKDRYLVLINVTKTATNYNFHKAWYPQYIGAQLIFWSDGARKEWRTVTSEGRRIETSALVPAFGMVVLRKSGSVN